MCVCVCVHMYVCVCVCMYVCVTVYMYVAMSICSAGGLSVWVFLYAWLSVVTSRLDEIIAIWSYIYLHFISLLFCSIISTLSLPLQLYYITFIWLISVVLKGDPILLNTEYCMLFMLLKYS